MNISASTFLQALSLVGVRSVRFRVLSQTDLNKHTTPVAVLHDEENASGHRMPRFSISELFNVYSLAPRKGEYVLDVDEGQLSFIPPKVRPAIAPLDVEASETPKKRWRPKVARRRVRAKSALTRKFPSA